LNSWNSRPSRSGTLGIQADAAPAFYLDSDFTAGSVKAYVKSAPVGADLLFTIYAGATAWLSLTIPAGSTSVAATQTQIDAVATIPANTNVRLAITAVGTISGRGPFGVHILVKATYALLAAAG
jgi:hypothetical protein